MTLLPGGIGFFELGATPEEGLFVDDLVLHRLSNGATWKGETAVLYKEYNGVPEIVDFLENGDTLALGDGVYYLKAFYWKAAMQPLKTSTAYCLP